MPYDTKNWQRKAAIAAATVTGGRGDPPQEIRRKLETSVEASVGLLTIRVTIVDAILVTVIRSLSEQQSKDQSTMNVLQGYACIFMRNVL